MVAPARITLVRAPNPSPLTLSGTNSYLIDCGQGRGVCIDPGPAIESHVEALVHSARRANLRIEQILITHGHPDHAPAAAPLARRTGASIGAHPQLAMPHDLDLHDGEALSIGACEFVTVDAPGHTFDHVVFYESSQRALFTGDVVLGEGTVVVAPPGGAMRPYQATLERLAREFSEARRIYGGHGEPVDDPQAKLREYIEHRRMREAQLVDALRSGPRTIPEFVEDVYAQTDRILWPAAARQVLAHLIALEQEGRVRSRAIERPMTAAESAILNPDWATTLAAADAKLVEAELGTVMRLDAILSYELVS